MFGIIADLFSSAITVLFPIFASYKALRSADPSQLAPWLMYWVVLSTILMAESWTVFILGCWFRLFFLTYLVLPQTQGARMLYQDYVDPLLYQHERDIEDFIGRSHERAKAMGLQYFYKAIELVREKVLGLPPQRPATPPPAPSGPASYAQSLLSRFNIPAVAGASAPAPNNDWFSAISSAVASVASAGQSPEKRAEELSARGSLLPRELASMSRSEKAKFISNQRDMLDVLRSALANEEQNLGNEDDGLAYGSSLRKNRSDNSFDHIEHEDIRDRSPARPGRTPSGNWASGWFGHGEQGQGGSSGVEAAAQVVDGIARSRGSHKSN
ncbi:hypothetical protein EYZ11_000849 [Aspergillus tanneri]|uniref:Protein YOP1 n=1 Tax=Aspergillus tanneri TaxID=1220188 RepID=A0A4S3JW47_9EURO|nr:hypothetical protein EYZ11_000849 [Aspergillus tanneri]